MPATQRGHARKLPSGKWQLRYRDNDGAYHAGGVHKSKTAALDHYGDVTLHELEGMSGDLADFRATLPPRFAHDVMRALRQTLAAGVRYGYMSSNPAVAAGDNPAPTPRTVQDRKS